MPTTRRSSGRNSAVVSGRQSTLSFSNNRVTKNVPKSAKDAAIAAPPAKAKLSPLSKEAEPEEEDTVQDATVIQDEKPAVSEVEEPDGVAGAEEEEPETVALPPAPERSEAELEAEKTTEAQIARYWKDIEAQRIAPRVHQEGLSVGEKVLRYFDVSSQYGPCIGMPRMRRWHRAQKLGLNPPVEVLAVLLKEDAKGNQEVERAHMDEIMNSTAVGAV